MFEKRVAVMRWLYSENNKTGFKTGKLLLALDSSKLGIKAKVWKKLQKY